jgi:hypothetical protein
MICHDFFDIRIIIFITVLLVPLAQSLTPLSESLDLITQYLDLQVQQEVMFGPLIEWLWNSILE